MSTALEKIEVKVQEFIHKVAECREASADGADFEDAYSRLYRARTRYTHEEGRGGLTRAERAAFEKVFERDNFLKGMLAVRVIGDHVKRNGSTLSYPNNSTFVIDEVMSGGVFFGERIVALVDKDGFERPWDHLKQLDEAVKRLEKALEMAKRG